MDKKVETAHVILFEGKPLPSDAYWLELIPSIIPETSDETREWTLDLHYCKGRIREEKSSRIRRYCVELLGLMAERRHHLCTELARRMPERDCAEVLDNWRETILVIDGMARSRGQCTWTSPASRDDVRSAGKALKFLFELMAKQNPDIDGSKARQAISDLTVGDDPVQMKVLHEVLDGMTSRSQARAKKERRKGVGRTRRVTSPHSPSAADRHD